MATLRTQVRLRPTGLPAPQLSSPLAAVFRRHVPPQVRDEPERPPPGSEPGAASRANWYRFLDGVPRFACSDPFFERYWYYRWYGLQLCSHEGGVGNHVYPGCCEGTGYFHVPIAYSAQCHARELRWLAEPDRAWGSLLNILAHQK
ncbi:MAG: hypothetical protein GWN32_11220, partial [Gemmatimonadetes bacterium]|nr:hypothetical protein [Gemmatimonadota bacterium]